MCPDSSTADAARRPPSVVYPGKQLPRRPAAVNLCRLKTLLTTTTPPRPPRSPAVTATPSCGESILRPRGSPKQTTAPSQTRAFPNKRSALEQTMLGLHLRASPAVTQLKCRHGNPETREAAEQLPHSADVRPEEDDAKPPRCQTCSPRSTQRRRRHSRSETRESLRSADDHPESVEIMSPKRPQPPPEDAPSHSPKIHQEETQAASPRREHSPSATSRTFPEASEAVAQHQPLRPEGNIPSGGPRDNHATPAAPSRYQLNRQPLSLPH